MENNKTIPAKTLLAAVLLTSVVPIFAADQLTVIGGARAELHDNAALKNTDKESDLVRIANADIAYKKPDGAINVDLDYLAEYRNYLHNTQSDQTSINGRSSFVWQIQPRLLDAVLSHQISQQLTDRRGLDVSNNRQERSVVTGGLDGFLHLSTVDSLVLSPRFTDVNFQEDKSSNSQRSTFSAAWEHKLNVVSTLDLTGAYDHVTFADSQNDYNSPSAMLSYHTALARLSYQLGVGYNRFNRDHGQDFNGSLARFGFDYKGDGFDWGASYVHQLTDSSIGLSNVELSLANFKANDSNFKQFDIVVRDQVDAFVQKSLSISSQLRASLQYLKENYKLTPQDQQGYSGTLSYRYTFNSFWSSSIAARYDHAKFSDDPSGLKRNTTQLSALLEYRPFQALALQLSVARDKRNANVATATYTDNMVMVGAQYHFY